MSKSITKRLSNVFSLNVSILFLLFSFPAVYVYTNVQFALSSKNNAKQNGTIILIVLVLFLFYSTLMVRSAFSRVSNHEARGHPSRRRFAAPQDEDLCQAALSVALSLSSVIRPAVCACANAAASAALALPVKICAAIASCSAQALSR